MGETPDFDWSWHTAGIEGCVHEHDKYLEGAACNCAEANAILAAAIVCRLAELSPNVDSAYSGDPDVMWHECALCEMSLPVTAEDHAPDCPWRRAVEWVAAHDDEGE